ncbi:T9SS-dependent M36 family metallopeptidase [Winogradskyella aurantia]|uniref:Peptidase n=1 Tax=Winogradskyella aurantia TaxID=1915063 RepID=A0A265V0F6_9FLAO|nr:T9SS-dependent M36 family metallopeptidase [Winogradskyella aurantia]OZV71053.1 peptidase [Winogradskyella aurantia]
MKQKLRYVITSLIVFALTLSINAQITLQNSEYNNLLTNYLNDSKIRYNFEDGDISDLYVNNQYDSESTGLTHVYLNQAYQGKRIYNAISSVAIKEGKVFYYGNRFKNNLNDKVNATSPIYTPQGAILKAAVEFELGVIQGLDLIEASGYHYTFTNSGISSQNIPVELVYVSVGNELKLAWDLKIYKFDNSNWWSIRVDAITGEIIEFDDMILTCKFEKVEEHLAHSQDGRASFDFFKEVNYQSSLMVDGSSYNVFPIPVESPNHGNRQIVNNPANPVASPFGWHDTDGNVGAEFTITRGNNVLAKEDTDGLNETGTIGFSPDGGEALNFDFSLDFSLSPIDYQEAAITNLFYMNNMMHDIWFNYGFNERSGNFQATNYTGFGFGNDFVVADGQDGSGLNNANFGTPPDGLNPRMQMFLWSTAGGAASQLNIINGSLAGTYSGVAAAFGEELSSSSSISGALQLVTDTDGDELDFCNELNNPSSLNNRIAIIRRGSCEFGFKVLAAENAGAIGAIVVNNVPDSPIVMGAGAVGNSVTIPSIMVSQTLGESIILALQNGENLNIEIFGPDTSSFVDSNFDNVIIAHEYGHGISNRLTGGPSAVNCLNNDEQMGEGWSDWFGLVMTMTSSDVPENGRGVGTFAISQPTTGQGIRPARYSTDFGVNPATYEDSNFLSQPHGIGFVWATALWDLTWAYIDKYGFDPDLYNGTGGNNRIMQLVIDGLKLQPCQPGFIDGRDALLAADLATTGGVDQCMIWEVFAARGLGFNAVQGSSLDRADQVEDFSLPPSDDPSLANCSSLSAEEFTNGSLRVYPNPTKTELQITSNDNFGEVFITLIDINGRIVYRSQGELFNTISINTSSLRPGLYILNIKGDTVEYNEKIIKN